MSEMDLLARATSALREDHGGAPAAPGVTRARIVRGVRMRQHARRAAALLAALLVAFVAVPSAWAWVTGRPAPILAPLLRALSPPAPRSDSSVEPRRRARHAARRVTVTAAQTRARADAEAMTPLPEAMPSPVALANVDAPSHAAALLRTRAPVAARRASGRPASLARATTPSAPDVPRSVEPSPDALYSHAHEAHFVQRDPVVALAAWDRYLARAPNGTFALEARYNRALDLIRLGERARASEALTPFASGRFGEYRRAEAQALLDALARQP